MKVQLAKWGNSVGLRVPKAALEALDVVPGQELDLTIANGELRLRPIAPIPRYRLEDLIAEMKRLGPEAVPPFEDWGPPVGNEIIDDDYSR